MSAAVIPFPSTLTAAVVQHPRRGRLPKAVGSIRQAASRRLAETIKARAKAASDAAAVMGCFREIEQKAASAKITGVVIVGCDQTGKRHAWWGGSFRREPIRAASLMSQTAPLIACQPPNKDG